MSDAGQKVFHLDAMFLLAELLPEEERQRTCCELGNRMRDMNNAMRELDLALLMDGQSALLAVGF